MVAATITSKGQTTIPKPVRDQLRLKAGDRIEFVLQDDGTALLVPASVRLSDLVGMLPRPERPVSLEEMERAIRRRGRKL